MLPGDILRGEVLGDLGRGIVVGVHTVLTSASASEADAHVVQDTQLGKIHTEGDDVRAHAHVHFSLRVGYGEEQLHFIV